MLILSIILILSSYVYLFKKHKEVLAYIPISKKRVLKLYNKVNTHQNKGSLYLLYIRIIMVVLLIVLMALTLKLNLRYVLALVIMALSFLPLVLIYNINNEMIILEFNNLEVYLTQFILIFKSNGKIVYTLEEVKDTLSGPVKKSVGDALNLIKEGYSSQEALASITKTYSHFIVYNLHSLVNSVESYGSSDYYEALDLIQDDIDDWSEDINNYNYSKKDIIRKVNILILFAYVICFIALKMLFSVQVETNTSLYQTTIFLFCFIEMITFVSTQSILNYSFIQKRESIC